MINHKTLKTFDELYNSSYQSVLKYAICSCSNIEDVYDIVQNTYLELLKTLEKENHPIINNAYILGIAKNIIRKYYRFKYKAKIVSMFSSKEEISLIDTIPDDINILEDLIQKEDLKFIWNFLKKKKVIIAKIFYLYYYEDMSIKNIAKSLNISESNVKHYLYRTLNELKNIMNTRRDKNV